jgi:hypothetical protein
MHVGETRVYAQLPKGIVCLTSASAYNDMSSFNYLPLILYADVESNILGGLFSLRPCKKLNFDETYLHWSGLHVTSP